MFSLSLVVFMSEEQALDLYTMKKFCSEMENLMTPSQKR